MRLFTATTVALLFTGSIAFSSTPESYFGTTIINTSITPEEVQAAQDGWCRALVSIAQENEARGQRRAARLAGQIIDSAYGYNLGAVLFKPTLTHGEQTFRTTREGALAYFVGQDRKFPNDSGFALKGWQACKYKNAAVHINGDVAITMGNVMLTGKDGSITTVDKTWGFRKDDQGNLRIILHHSSLPFSSN